MTKTTITISRNLYGVYITDGILDADCTMGKRMDGTIGLCISGNLLPQDEALTAAIIAMFDAPRGTKQTITFGEAVDNSAEIAAYEQGRRRTQNAMTLNNTTI